MRQKPERAFPYLTWFPLLAWFRLPIRLVLLSWLLTACGSAEQICDEGETIPFLDCGTCVCQYGSWSCGCGDGPIAGDGDGDGDGDGAPPLCQEGKTRSSGCNTCTCQNGAWSCTDKACRETCVANTEITVDCGACHCTLEGVWDCDDPGCAVETCEGFGIATCGSGRFCYYPDGNFCGYLGTDGVCIEDDPQGCDGNYDPICGCDGNTYSNTCEARSQRVSVAVRGACPTR